MAVTPAKGTLLQMEIAEVFTTVAQRVSIDPPEMTREKIETTDLDSDAETSIAGIIRPGDVSMTCNIDPANATHQALWAAYQDGGVNSYKLVYADAKQSEDEFDAWISSYKKGTAEVDGLVTLELTFTVTGNVTHDDDPEGA